MSATTNINIRVDTDLKQDAETLFHDLGLTMSGAMTLFLRAAVNYNGIPFEVKRPEPNTVTKAALAEYEEMRRNPGAYKRYHSVDELFDEVLQDV
ncbi:MAG: type II toxin-antitoxin system RelB/DinJ family antitoxin [Oscillibacter sp.]|nr:type II toxin-antitoxin system RelB/DinJ family antitoxin [Oscillibacter sp.]